MSKHINIVQAQIESNSQVVESNRFSDCEQIVDELVEKGLPSTFVPDNFISKISKTYNITYQEARTCLKLALKQLEQNQAQEEASSEKLNGQCGYFYPQGYTKNTNTTRPNDGMDSLASLSSYNRLMFGLR